MPITKWFKEGECPDQPVPYCCWEGVGPSHLGKECPTCRSGKIEDDALTVTHRCANTWCRECFWYAYQKAGPEPACPVCHKKYRPASKFSAPKCSVISHTGRIAAILDPSGTDFNWDDHAWVMEAECLDFLADKIDKTPDDEDDSSRIPGADIPPAGLVEKPTSLELIQRIPDLDLTTAELDTLWGLVNIFGIPKWRFIAPMDEYDPYLSFYVPQNQGIEVCKDIEEVERLAGEEWFRKAREQPSKTLQMPVSSETVRLFLRSLSADRFERNDEIVEDFNKIASSSAEEVKDWAVLQIEVPYNKCLNEGRPSQTVFICPWPKDQLPASLGPVPFPGWTQRPSSASAFDEKTDAECLRRFIQRQLHEQANEQTPEQEARLYYGDIEYERRLQPPQIAACFQRLQL